MKRKRKNSRLLYCAYRLAIWLLSCIPLSFAFRLGQGLGFLTWLVLSGYRRLADRNVKIALGDAVTRDDRTRIVRRHFQNLGANLLSIPALARLSETALHAHVEFSNVSKILQLYNQGHGGILLLSHIGNWEMLAQISALLPTIRAAAIYQALGNPLIDRHVRSTREARGVRLFSRSDGFDAPTQFVRSGGLLGVLADQHAGDKGVWTPFFGRIASTSPLIAILAQRTKAPILPVALQTIGCARWRLIVDDPIEPGISSPAELTACVNQVLEKQILRKPEDWFWVHNRWKTPRPAFLLRHYRRGTYVASGQPDGTLKPFRILVRSSNWLGDAVMSTPAIQAIKQGRPDAQVTILCKAKLADFWRTVPWVDDILSIPDHESLLAIAARLRKSPSFDVGIVLPNSLRTGLELLLAGIPRRVGYAGHHRAWTLNQVIPEHLGTLRAEHHVNHYLNLASHIGADINEVQFGIAASSDTSRFHSVDQGILRIGLCPGAEYGSAKRWPLEHFAATASEVSKRRSCQWIIFGTAKEASLGEDLCKSISGQAINLVGKTSLAQLIDELRGCRALLTNDTGTMHLAAFLGIPVVAVFGSTEPRLTGPLGSGHMILHHQVECSPCFLRVCPLDFRCMKSIEVDEAVEAVLRTLS